MASLPIRRAPTQSGLAFCRGKVLSCSTRDLDVSISSLRAPSDQAAKLLKSDVSLEIYQSKVSKTDGSAAKGEAFKKAALQRGQMK